MGNNRYNNKMYEKDFNYIKENYQKKSVKEISKELNKCETTIYKAISKMNLKYENRDGKVWNKDEIQYLKENFDKMTYKDIGIKLGRTKSSVEGKAHCLNLKKVVSSRTWSDEELDYLKENINNKSYDEISIYLNRSIGAIYNKVYELNLISGEFKKCRKLKKEQINFILDNYKTMTDHQLAIKFNVSAETIAAVRKKYGLLKNGNETKHSTYIEDAVENILKELNISYYKNFNLERYIPDFFINDKNIIIEVQGDYFHCNPYVYKNGPKDEIQLKHIINDYYKKCFYLSSGFKLVEIWEKEINEDISLVKEKIKSAVYGQGLQESIDD